MAIIFKTTDESGLIQWHITEAEANFSAGAAAKVEAVEIDEMILRGYAVRLLNNKEKSIAAAKKREAQKTAEQRSDAMKKAWIKRKAEK